MGLEIGVDLPHAGALGGVERTAPVTVAAPDAGVGLDGQLLVVVFGHLVPGQGQVIVFVDQGDVDAGGAGLAVVAVDAVALGGGGGELAGAGHAL